MNLVPENEVIVSDSVEQTERVAALLATQLSPGDIVLLSGELGSGKTAFVRGAARALGVAGPVTSPTYAIGNVYTGESGEIAHLDLYRLDSLSIDDEAVTDDFLTPERIGFVEWPHGELTDEARLRAVVELAHLGEHEREIAVRWVR